MSNNIVKKVGSLETIQKASNGKGYTFCISSENPDLVGDIVVQKGLVPVSSRIPAQCDHSGEIEDLCGYWENLRIVGKKTLADLITFPKGLSQVSDLVSGLLDAGIAMGASIGFKSVESEFRDPKLMWEGGMIYKKATLLECSVVVVPCNSDAISIAKSLNINKSIVERVLQQSDSDPELAIRKEYALKRANRFLAKA